MEKKWKLIKSCLIQHYVCGLVAGQRVRLLKNIVVKDSDGRATGKVIKAGGIWEVAPGSDESPVAVWLRRADGERQTWDDDSSIYEYFEVVKPVH
jgi:hypothetical protein